LNISPGQAGGAAGSIVGSLIPIPGAGQILGIVGQILGGMIGGKPSNDTAYIWFTAGPHPEPWPGGNAGVNCTGNVCGDEAVTQTKALGAQISEALAAILEQYFAQGVTFRSPAFVITVGGRDAPGILKADHSGSWYARSVAALGDAQGTVAGVLNWLSQYASSSAMPQSSVPGSNYIMRVPPPGAPPAPAPPANSPVPAPPAADPGSAPAAAPPAPVTAGFDWTQLSNFSTPYPYGIGLATLFFFAMMMRR
jgi:hypothetical protein